MKLDSNLANFVVGAILNLHTLPQKTRAPKYYFSSEHLHITFDNLFYSLVTVYSCMAKRLLPRVSHVLFSAGVIDRTEYLGHLYLPNACI